MHFLNYGIHKKNIFYISYNCAHKPVSFLQYVIRKKKSYIVGSIAPPFFCWKESLTHCFRIGQNPGVFRYLSRCWYYIMHHFSFVYMKWRRISAPSFKTTHQICLIGQCYSKNAKGNSESQAQSSFNIASSRSLAHAIGSCHDAQPTHAK